MDLGTESSIWDVAPNIEFHFFSAISAVSAVNDHKYDE
jgi:hypothetical protein